MIIKPEELKIVYEKDDDGRIRPVYFIDAEPVRHGRWGYKHFSSEPHCSLCLAEYPIETNYCPNCGARMEVDDGLN